MGRSGASIEFRMSISSEKLHVTSYPTDTMLRKTTGSPQVMTQKRSEKPVVNQTLLYLEEFSMSVVFVYK